MKKVLFILLSIISATDMAAQLWSDVDFSKTIGLYYDRKEIKEIKTFPDQPGQETVDEFLVDFYFLDMDKDVRQFHPVIGYYDTRGLGHIDGMYEGPYDAIDIRMEDGCIYVKRDEYLAMMEDDSPWHALANKEYMPYRQTADGELVLYDFNMRVGDKYLSVEGYPDISVTEVSKLKTLDGVERRLLTLSNGCQLLEGIGCLNSPGMLYFYLNPSAYMEEYCKNTKPTLRMITKGDDIVFSYDDNMGVEDINSKTSVFNPQTSTLFDLQGRRLTQVPAKGVFIQNGKKVTY